MSMPPALRSPPAAPGSRLPEVCPLTRIGVIESAPGLRVVDAEGHVLPLQVKSFDHFKS